MIINTPIFTSIKHQSTGPVSALVEGMAHSDKSLKCQTYCEQDGACNQNIQYVLETVIWSHVSALYVPWGGGWWWRRWIWSWWSARAGRGGRQRWRWMRWGRGGERRKKNHQTGDNRKFLKGKFKSKYLWKVMSFCLEQQNMATELCNLRNHME